MLLALVPEPDQFSAGWFQVFKPFTAAHLIALLWTGTLVVGSCVLGRRWIARVPEYEKRLAFAWGGFVIGVNVWSFVYWLTPAHYDVRESLPL